MASSRRKPLVLNVCCVKGGIGKTSTTAALAGACVERGLRPLVINLDKQRANINTCLHPEPCAAIDSPGYRVLRHSEPILDHVIHTAEGIDLLQGGKDLGDAEKHLLGEADNHALADRIAELPGVYDVVLIDCGPSLDMLTVNGMYASSHLLIPVELDYLSLIGMVETLDKARMIMKRHPTLKVAGVLPVKFDLRSLHAREIHAQMLDQAGKLFLDKVPIRIDKNVRDAHLNHMPVTHYAKNTRAAHEYRALRDILLRRAA